MPQPDFGSKAIMNFNGQDVEVSADELEFVKTLGRGQYGQVDKFRFRGIEFQHGFEFAVKVSEWKREWLGNLVANLFVVVFSFGFLSFRRGNFAPSPSNWVWPETF